MYHSAERLQAKIETFDMDLRVIAIRYILQRITDLMSRCFKKIRFIFLKNMLKVRAFKKPSMCIVW